MMTESARLSQAQALIDQSFRIAINAGLTGPGSVRISPIKRQLRNLNIELLRLYAANIHDETRLMRARLTIENLEAQDD